MEVDSEQLICEVRKYPCIYDRSDPGHSDRFVKAEAWKQIQASLVGEGYEELGKEERNNVGVAINKKWKALKDAFWRSIKTCEERSETKGVRTKKYVYYEQLRFLLQSSRKRRAFSHNNKEESGQSADEEIEGIEIKTEEPIVPKPGIIFPTTMRGTKRSIDSVDDCDLRDPLEIMNGNSNTMEECPPGSLNAQENADKLFLLSLLPDMQSLGPKQKFTFKIKALHLLHDLQEKQITSTS